jgi:hypothetical protein
MTCERSIVRVITFHTAKRLQLEALELRFGFRNFKLLAAGVVELADALDSKSVVSPSCLVSCLALNANINDQ